MRVEIERVVAEAEPKLLFERLADFGSYAEFTEAVHEVTVREEADGRSVSDWKVQFRNGVLHWTERDEIDWAGLVIRFEQITGDFASFNGYWAVEPTPEGALVRFVADFDMGIPSLAPMLDPIAERALRDNIEQMLTAFEPAESVIDLTRDEAPVSNPGAGR